MILPVRHRAAFSELRCGVAPIRIETGRYEGLTENLRLCPFCNVMETKMHVILNCQVYGRVLPCASINTTLRWIPTYPYPSIVIPYPSTYPTLPTVGKIPLPTLSIYPTYSIHVTLSYIPVSTSHYLLLGVGCFVPFPFHPVDVSSRDVLS